MGYFLSLFGAGPTHQGPWALIQTCKYSTNFEKLSHSLLIRPLSLLTSSESPALPCPVSTSLGDLLDLISETL